jgi:ABC-type multidrug transport system fused ATPase/permease subunit
MSSVFEIIKIIIKQKWKFILSVIMMVFSGVTAGISILILIPIAQTFIATNTNQLMDTFIKVFEYVLIFLHIKVSLYSMLGALILFNIFKAIFDLLKIYILQDMLMIYEVDARNSLFSAFIKTKWNYLLKAKHGKIQNALITEVRNVSQLIFTLCSILSHVITIIVYIIAAISLIGFINILFILIIGFFISLCLSKFLKIAKRYGRRMVDSNNKIHSIVLEGLSGLKYIKASFLHEYYLKRFNKNVKIFTKVFRNSQILLKGIKCITDPLVIIGLSFFLIIIKLLNFEINIVLLGISILAFNKIYSNLMILLTHFQRVAKNLPSIDLCTNIIKESEKEYEQLGSENYRFLDKEIKFEDVSFWYIKNHLILKDAVFSIKAGETVALVGKSGSGKTTIVDIILGLYHVNKGSVLIDGIDINKINLKKYRKRIGYVPQDPFIINDTILANITLGYNDYNIEDVNKVLKMAYINEFLTKMPNHLETVVGEKGTKLSGGQKQRIALARALFKNPDILILDEATSALDNQSEFYVQKAIENLKNKLTIIVIAHRLNTVKNADILFEVDDGKVKEVKFKNYIKKMNDELLNKK